MPSHESFRQALSDARLAPYLAACGDDFDLAWELYLWNGEVSASFHEPLKHLEVTFRNMTHGELLTHYGRPDWWNVIPLAGDGGRLVEEVRDRVRRTARRNPNADDVVAGLSFGFWVSLLNRGNNAALWTPAVHRVFRPGYRGSRRDLHHHFEHLRRFRNRIMHYEPIYTRDLGADIRRIHQLIELMAPPMAQEVRRIDTVPAVMARAPRLPGQPIG